MFSYASTDALTVGALNQLYRTLSRMGWEANQGEVGVVIDGKYFGITDYFYCARSAVLGEPLKPGSFRCRFANLAQSALLELGTMGTLGSYIWVGRRPGRSCKETEPKLPVRETDQF